MSKYLSGVGGGVWKGRVESQPQFLIFFLSQMTFQMELLRHMRDVYLYGSYIYPGGNSMPANLAGLSHFCSLLQKLGKTLNYPIIVKDNIVCRCLGQFMVSGMILLILQVSSKLWMASVTVIFNLDTSNFKIMLHVYILLHRTNVN